MKPQSYKTQNGCHNCKLSYDHRDELVCSLDEPLPSTPVTYHKYFSWLSSNMVSPAGICDHYEGDSMTDMLSKPLFPQETNVLIDDIRQIAVIKNGSGHEFVSFKDDKVANKIRAAMCKSSDTQIYDYNSPSLAKLQHQGLRSQEKSPCGLGGYALYSLLVGTHKNNGELYRCGYPPPRP